MYFFFYKESKSKEKINFFLEGGGMVGRGNFFHKESKSKKKQKRF